MSVDYFEEQRREMVAAIRAITDHVAAQISKSALDTRVLEAMAKVPRHEFVPVEVQQYAYLNRPLPIGFDKTISQPLMVAVMTDLLELKPNDVVLEIGTGLGYQAAVLAEPSGKVYSVEIIDELAQRAVQRLKRQGYTNIAVRVGNGYSGWPEHAPFEQLMARRRLKCSPMELCKPTISLRLDSPPRYPLSFPFGAHPHRWGRADVEAGGRWRVFPCGSRRLRGSLAYGHRCHGGAEGDCRTL
jgi:protein-L-isoaspartate(D-aspartate) O-methyltransferase